MYKLENLIKMLNKFTFHWNEDYDRFTITWEAPRGDGQTKILSKSGKDLELLIDEVWKYA